MAKKDFTPAQAVELYIGSYRFDAIRIVKKKEYRMSQNHILEAIGINKNWLTRLHFSLTRVYKTLEEQGLNQVTLFAEYTVKTTVTRAITWSLKDELVNQNTNNILYIIRESY